APGHPPHGPARDRLLLLLGLEPGGLLLEMWVLTAPGTGANVEGLLACLGKPDLVGRSERVARSAADGPRVLDRPRGGPVRRDPESEPVDVPVRHREALLRRLGQQLLHLDGG